MKPVWKIAACLYVLLTLANFATVDAAPFAKTIRFDQPNGSRIELWGMGDEFAAVFETLDGYSVVFDFAQQAYCYARRANDGTELLSTGVQVGQGNPAILGLTPHLRICPQTVKAQSSAKRRQWEKGMDLSRRWQALKAARRFDEQPYKEKIAPRPLPSSPTIGNKVGLCLLVDFDDDPATVPQSNIVDFCNGDAYAGFGNNGSVKTYFQDNSGGLLTYSNVVTAYIRIPNSLHPKSYYVDTSVFGNYITNGQNLIRDALAVMKALPNYTTEILPTFNALTVGPGHYVVAFNVLFAGGYGNVWLSGLNPHCYWMESHELSPGGQKLVRYQISPIEASLELGTFCHENGHMLCGFWDIYDYDLDSCGGAGSFCLMGLGGGGTNPVQFNAYLKWGAGWGTVSDFTRQSSLTASAGPGFNRFYRFPRPGVTTEYFMAENRQKTGRDVNLGGAGIALWHIDELGDHNNQSRVANTNHANYEVTLVQADNLWHFQNNVNTGDPNDLYYCGNTAVGYSNTFSDRSAPGAHWWDGTPSGLVLSNFSATANTMTFDVDTPGVLQFSASSNTVNETGGNVTLTVTRSGGSSGEARVGYGTVDGTAGAGTDYTARSGSLTWADGDTAAQTIAIPIMNRSGSQGSRSFSVVLSSASGAALGSPVTQVVTIESMRIGPLIKANNLEGSVTVSESEFVSMTVELVPGPYEDVPVDWWIAACVGGWDWYYVNSALQWRSFDGHPATCQPVHQGPLFNLRMTTILDRVRLSPGVYDFWFAVDYPLDGSLNLAGQMVLDRVTVSVIAE